MIRENEPNAQKRPPTAKTETGWATILNIVVFHFWISIKIWESGRPPGHETHGLLYLYVEPG